MNRRNIVALYYLIGVPVMVFIASLFSACSENTVEKQLSQAEFLIITQPDSTVAILAHMDTTRMNESQRARQELLYLYTQSVYGHTVPLDMSGIAWGDNFFTGRLDKNEIRFCEKRKVAFTARWYIHIMTSITENGILYISFRQTKNNRHGCYSSQMKFLQTC